MVHRSSYDAGRGWLAWLAGWLWLAQGSGLDIFPDRGWGSELLYNVPVESDRGLSPLSERETRLAGIESELKEKTDEAAGLKARLLRAERELREGA